MRKLLKEEDYALIPDLSMHIVILAWIVMEDLRVAAMIIMK